MALVDRIISAESGGNPNARNSKSSASLQVFYAAYVLVELWVVRIIELLFVSRPTAILRLVIPTWVNAINSVFGGRLGTHLREKILKARPPAVADLDALRPIIFVTDVFWARASFFHRAPCAVFSGLFHAMSLHGRPHSFFMQASAALRL